jgi:hypothetical protein
VRFPGPNSRFKVSEVGYGTEMIFIIIQYHKYGGHVSGFFYLRVIRISGRKYKNTHNYA